MRGPAAMQAIGGTEEKIEKKEKTRRKPSFWNKWNAVKLYDRLWFNYIPGLNVIFHFLEGKAGRGG